MKISIVRSALFCCVCLNSVSITDAQSVNPRRMIDSWVLSRGLYNGKAIGLNLETGSLHYVSDGKRVEVKPLLVAKYRLGSRMFASGKHIWVLAAGKTLNQWDGTKWIEHDIVLKGFYGVNNASNGIAVSTVTQHGPHLLWIPKGSNKPQLFPSIEPPKLGDNFGFVRRNAGWIRIQFGTNVATRDTVDISNSVKNNGREYTFFGGIGKTLLYYGASFMLQKVPNGRTSLIRGKYLTPTGGDGSLFSSERTVYAANAAGEKVLVIANAKGTSKLVPFNRLVDRERQRIFTSSNGDIIIVSWTLDSPLAEAWRYSMKAGSLMMVQQLPVPDTWEAITLAGDRFYIAKDQKIMSRPLVSKRK